MSVTHFLSLLTVSAGLLAVPNDRVAPAGRVFAGAAAVRAGGPPAASGFTLFGWVSPPVESTTVGRIAELRGAGMNLLLPAWVDSGRLADNLQRLDYAAANGARCLIWERRFERFLTLEVDSPEGGALLDSIVVDYRDHPGFFGYYLGDEPPPDEFPLLGKLHAALRARDPRHPAWNNLLGRSAFGSRADWESNVNSYLDQTGAAVLCDDQYDFLIGHDRGHFVENAAGLAAIARARGIPFWSIVLLIEHTPYRGLTDGELRWEVSTLLAYGAHGIGYFTYWTPAPDSFYKWKPAIIGWDGVRTHWYDLVAAFNPRVHAAGQTLGDLVWLSTEHSGSVPTGGTAFAPDGWISKVEGRAAIGHFLDTEARHYLLVANSDSAAAQTITLTLPGARRVERLGVAPGAWTDVAITRDVHGARVELTLEAGDFVLVRARGLGPLAAGVPPGIRAVPNPARGQITFALTRLAVRARVEILDSGGRRLWARTVGPGDSTLIWGGERDGGGFAPAGLYFVRVEDARGLAVTRVSWLGR